MFNSFRGSYSIKSSIEIEWEKKPPLPLTIVMIYLLLLFILLSVEKGRPVLRRWSYSIAVIIWLCHSMWLVHLFLTCTLLKWKTPDILFANMRLGRVWNLISVPNVDSWIIGIHTPAMKFTQLWDMFRSFLS